jgi:hypothetical protein
MEKFCNMSTSQSDDKMSHVHIPLFWATAVWKKKQFSFKLIGVTKLQT